MSPSASLHLKYSVVTGTVEVAPQGSCVVRVPQTLQPWAKNSLENVMSLFYASL